MAPTEAAACAALTGTLGAAALTRTVVAPLAGTRTALTTLARTTATEAAALPLALAGTARTTATTVISSRTSHRMRTRNITRRRGVHTLLAGERVVARARALSVRARSRSIAAVVLMLNRLAIVRTALVVTTIVVTAIVRATLTTVLTAFAIIATILTVVVLTVAAGGRHAGACAALRTRCRCTRSRSLLMCRGRRCLTCGSGRSRCGR